MNAAAISAWENYVGQRFSELKSHFPDCIPANDPRVLSVKSARESWHDLKVLDLGCGRGRYEKHFQSWGAKYIGIDLSAEFLGSGKSQSPCLVGSALHLPFANDSFDVVALIETLQHSPVPEIAIQNAIESIRPGGSLIVIERNPLALSSDWPLLPARFVKWIDEYRGRWMYPVGSLAREGWISPGKLNSIISDSIISKSIMYIGSTEQKETTLQRLIRRTRPFYCFIAIKK